MPAPRKTRSKAVALAGALAPAGKKGLTERLTQLLLEVISTIPGTKEGTSATPELRARSLSRTVALECMSVSGTAALAWGPWGFATLLPDLYAVYKLQSQMVADIAAVYGKTATLGSEQMIYCLFKHGGAHLVRDLVTRVGERFLVQKASVRFIQSLIAKIGFKLTQRLIGKTIARWIPVVGVVGVGYYAFRDTKSVAETAIELFSREIVVIEDGAL